MNNLNMGILLDQAANFKTSKRIVWVDAIKGLCILLVMMVHASYIPFVLGILGIGYMGCFFIVSGYTYNVKERIDMCISDEIKKKAKRLLIPYFVYGVLFSIIFSIDDIFKGNISPFIYNVKCLLLVSDLNAFHSAPLWFLMAMFVAYILMIIYYKVKYSSYILLLYFIAALCVCKVQTFFPFKLDIGIIASLLLIYGSKKKMVCKDIPITIIFILSYYLFYHLLGWNVNMPEKRFWGIGLPGVILFVIMSIIETDFLQYLFDKMTKIRVLSVIPVFLSKIGNMSLTILCIHAAIYALLNPFLSMYLSNVTYISLAKILLSLFISYMLTFLFGKLKYKYTLLKYL